MSRKTIKDIARESGVSTATVSRVLSKSGYASEETKEKVLRVAKELNYQPNGIARSLKMERTNTIGVIIPDISNPYFMQISKGIEDVVQQDSYNLIFASSDENPIKEKEMLKVLLEKRVDAIVLATSGNNIESIEKAKLTGVPIILVDRKVDDEKLKLDSVVEDNFYGAYKLAEYLIKNNHRKIGIINGPLSVSTGIERFSGYKHALKDNGIELNEDLIYSGNFLMNDGKEAVNYFINRLNLPTAILSFNNTMTFGVILQLTRLGLEIPKDMVVASYGETEVSKLLNPPGIICAKQSPYKIGVRAGKLVLTRLKNRTKEVINEVYKPKVEFDNKSST